MNEITSKSLNPPVDKRPLPPGVAEMESRNRVDSFAVNLIKSRPRSVQALISRTILDATQDSADGVEIDWDPSKEKDASQARHRRFSMPAPLQTIWIEQMHQPKIWGGKRRISQKSQGGTPPKHSSSNTVLIDSRSGHSSPSSPNLNQSPHTPNGNGTSPRLDPPTLPRETVIVDLTEVSLDQPTSPPPTNTPLKRTTYKTFSIDEEKKETRWSQFSKVWCQCWKKG